MRNLFVAIIVITVALGGSAAARNLAATPQTFDAVVKQAKGGDVIVLASGRYANVNLRGRSFRPSLVVDARAAVMAGWRLFQFEGLEIRGGQFALGPTVFNERMKQPVEDKEALFRDVRAIKVAGVQFIGHKQSADADDSAVPGEGYGLYVVGGSDITVENSRFEGLKIGLVLTRVDGFKVSGNSFTRMASDGMDYAQSRNGLIERNICKDMVIRDGQHPDCIQLWSRLPEPPVSDIIIRQNTVTGYTQGISLFNHQRNGVDDGGFDRITIEDNDIAVQVTNGITLVNGRSSIVRNNRVRTLPGAKLQAMLRLRNPIDVRRCGNVIGAGGGRSGIKDPPC